MLIKVHEGMFGLTRLSELPGKSGSLSKYLPSWWSISHWTVACWSSKHHFLSYKHVFMLVLCALVLLCKTRYVFFKKKVSLSRLVCVLPQREIFLPFFSLFASHFLRSPLMFCMLCLIKLSLTSLLTGTINVAIAFRTLWTTSWLVMISHKSTSLTARLR